MKIGEKKLSIFSRKKLVIIFLLLISLSVGSIFIFFSNEIVQKYIPWELKKLVGFIEKNSVLDLRVRLCLPDKDIKFKRDDGLTIAGSLYGVNDNQKKPGIILLHGNTPLGRKLPIYKLLAKKFAIRGYIVLSLDFAGYGESDDPFLLGTKEALNSDKDVYAALDYLKDLKNLIQDQIYVIGHSAGAGAAFSVGIKEDNIKKIVTIGPSRRITERLNNPNDRNYFWKRALRTKEEIYKKGYPSWYKEKLWLESTLSYYDMKKYIPYFSKHFHKPLFLIDGELESKKDKIYLQKYYQRITEPKKYLTISNSDHYCNTIEVLGINLYDKNVVNQVIDEIDQWLKL